MREKWPNTHVCGHPLLQPKGPCRQSGGQAFRSRGGSLLSLSDLRSDENTR